MSESRTVIIADLFSAVLSSLTLAVISASRSTRASSLIGSLNRIFSASFVSAALVLGDKSDAHKTRVRNGKPDMDDIHDRVNYSVTASELMINAEKKTMTLELKVDTAVSSVMEYFEIFMKRMLMCRKAASQLGAEFRLIINDQQLL